MSYTQRPATLIARRGYSDTSGIESVVSAIGGAGKSLVSGVLGIIGGTSRSEGEAEAAKNLAMAQANQPQSSTPSWVLPAAVVGVGVVAVVLLRRRKK